MCPVDSKHPYMNFSIPESLVFLTPDPPSAETLKPLDFNPEP